MSSLGVTPQDVIKAIQSQNVQAAVGRVGAAPLTKDVEFQLNINTQGRLTSVEEFENIIVRATEGGGLVRVKDLARVELGSKTADAVSRYNGKPASGIAIYQSPGANAIAVAEGVRKVLKDIELRLPEDVAYDVMYDTTVFVQAMIESVQHTLVEAFILVAIVVFIFLGNFRATIIPIVAVPVALVGTFAVMLAMGFSANTVSLLALVLAIGIVVDDAIVVVEAVEHKLETEPNLTPAEATEKAMSEVTGPIIAITLVLLSVFVPTAFIPGITGQLYQQFAVAVSVSMVISAINALSLSPALCSILLKHRGHPTGLMARLQRGIDKSRDGYVALVTPLARRAVIAGVLVLGFALATGGLTRIVPTGFLPDEDQGAFMGEVQLPEAASLNRTTAVLEGIEKIVMESPSTQNIFSVVGFSLLDGLALPNKALLVVALKPFDERKNKSMSVFAALDDLQQRFKQLAAANVFVFNLPPIAGLGTGSGFEFQLQTLTGSEPQELAAVARGLVSAASASPQLAGVFTTYGAATPQAYLDIDRERAETLGIPISDIFSPADDDGRHLRQRLQSFRPHMAGKRPGRCVRSQNGGGCFSRAAAHRAGRSGAAAGGRRCGTRDSAASIIRYNNLRSVTINGGPAPGFSSGAAISAMESVAKATLPAGFTYEWTGTALQEKAAAGQTGSVLALAVLFAYLFLVALYESWTIPIAALLSVVVGFSARCLRCCCFGSTTISMRRSASSS